MPDARPVTASRSGSLAEVFLVALRLGLTSFGGPVAHIGYFRDEYVARRRWLDDATFAELVAIGHFLPGPASSQVGIAIGTLRAGRLGGLLAWLGFTLPSALAMIAFALLLRGSDLANAGWADGLKVVAVAVVALAVVALARSLTPDLPRLTVAVGATVVALAWPGTAGQLLVIAAGAVAGWLLPWGDDRASAVPSAALEAGRRRFAILAAASLGALLIGFPLLRGATDAPALATADGFTRTGALVFGGGHVVLPLLHDELVPGGVSEEDFVAGYGAAQAMPGPLFTFAAYLGVLDKGGPGGVAGGVIALVAVFLPSFLLVWAVLPLWGALRRRPKLASALAGVNAAVVGLLAAAFYDPVLTSAIASISDAVLAAALLALLVARVPPIAVVLAGALGGVVLSALA